MKKILSLIFLLICTLGLKAQQATMPTIIVFPHDTWMNDHGFMETIDNDGKKEYLPKYNEAFAENREIGTVIQAISKVLKERGFEQRDLESVLKRINSSRAEDIASAAAGKANEISPMDELLQQANPDIKVDVDYSVASVGPRKNISFTLKAVDAYTSEQVASIESTIQMTMDPVDLAIRKAIAGNCDDFCQQMLNHFTDLRDNGRKINVTFRAAAGSGLDFMNDEVGDDGDTYVDFLEDWVRKHAVKNDCKLGNTTSNMVEFEYVRIPFFDENGTPYNARAWGRMARKAFNAETGLKARPDRKVTLGSICFLVGGQ